MPVRLATLCVAALGASAVMTQLTLMRELLSVFGGNELVLGLVLGNWLLLTGLGAALGRSAEHLRHPWRSLFWGQWLIAWVPLAQVGLARVLPPLVFVRGATPGVTAAWVASLLLLSPYCLVSGYGLALACGLLESDGRPPRGDDPAGGAVSATLHPDPGAVTAIYVADGLGSVAGGLLFTYVLVCGCDHFRLLLLPGFLNLGVAWMAARRGGEPSKLTFGLLGGAALFMLGVAWDGDRWATQHQHPGQRVVFRGHSPYGRLVVTESGGGQFNFLENGTPLYSTQDLERAEETVHYAMAQRPQSRAVLLLSGGLSGSAREALKYSGTEVWCVELDPVLLEVGRRLAPEGLNDPRVHVVNADGRRFVQQTRQRFDVVIVDAPDPTTSRINRYYTEEFFTEVKRSLVPGGVLACSLGRYENYVSEELARVLACGRRTLERCYTHVLPIPGGKVFFLASDGPLDQDIATALAREGIDTRHVRPSALRAIMSPDRLADLERAMAWPAGINRDFNPILYFYCLVHWASQYEVRAGLWTGVAVLAGAVYLLRLRPAPLVLFASGFAASALEMVLLLVFQILYGSVYRQVGAIVTLFMAGLAGGALAAARWSRARIASSPARVDGRRERRTLALTGLVLGAVAAALPLMLTGGPPGGGSATGAWLGPALIFGLSFALAALVGAQFPLAAQLEPSGPVTTASRLYAADLLGACLGALLASAFLIPVLGLRTVCWLTGGLCGLAALRLWGGRGS